MNTGKPVGETILYFGCRHSNEDYIYEEELALYKDEGLLTKLYVAFSRDQAQKVYVQHLLEQNGEEVWKILDKGGHIYVCGSVRVSKRTFSSDALLLIILILSTIDSFYFIT